MSTRELRMEPWSSTAAARDLPLAEELSTLLYDTGKGVDHDAVLEYVDWESELAEISRVEEGRLWLRSELGEIGPVIVAERASEIAKLGWQISAPGFGRTNAGWHILEWATSIRTGDGGRRDPRLDRNRTSLIPWVSCATR